MHRAFVSRVPFENLSVQLGESAPLDPGALVDRVTGPGGRGGYCFEVNTVLLVLLEGLGFQVERRQAIVGARDAHARGVATNHLTLVVRTEAGPHVADAGVGEGPLDPLSLATLEREGDGWWVAIGNGGSTPGWRFADAPATLEDFRVDHARLSRDPTSGFVRTLVVQQPSTDHVTTLRSRTLFVDGPDRHERALLESEADFAGALEQRFGITLDGDRMGRLWAAAHAQHAARGELPRP